MKDILVQILGWIPYIVTAAAAAAAALPVPADGTIWSTIRKVIDFLAVNVGNAKNQPPK